MPNRTAHPSYHHVVQRLRLCFPYECPSPPSPPTSTPPLPTSLCWWRRRKKAFFSKRTYYIQPAVLWQSRILTSLMVSMLPWVNKRLMQLFPCVHSFYFQTAVFYNLLRVRFLQRHCGFVFMLVTCNKRNDTGAFLLTSPRPNLFNARISEMGQRYIFPCVK